MRIETVYGRLARLPGKKKTGRRWRTGPGRSHEVLRKKQIESTQAYAITRSSFKMEAG